MKFNSDFAYDLEVGKVAEQELSFMLGSKIEVKRDLQAHKTGNVFIEYESRGKKSGISTTQADYYCIVVNDTSYILINTDKLKAMCREYLNTGRDIKGGDSNTSKGILLPLTDLINGDKSD